MASETLSERQAAAKTGDPLPEEFLATDNGVAPAAKGARWWRDTRRRRLLALADLGAAGLASVVAARTPTAALPMLAFLPLWIVVAKLLGLYDRDHRAIRHLTVDEVPTLAAWAAVCLACIAALLTLTPASPLSAGHAARSWLVAVAAVLPFRGLVRWVWRRITPRELTALVGDGELAAAIRRKVELFPDMHLELVAERLNPSLDGQGNGSFERMAGGIDRAIVAAPMIDPDFIAQLAATCRAHEVKLSVVSTLRGRAGAMPRITQLADLPVLEFNTWDVPRSTMVLKRVFDVTVSAALLTLSVATFPLVALAIRLDGGGPAIFSQLRAGIGGRPFRMYKFRTMHRNAAERLSEVVDLDALSEPVFKFRRDPRITRVGRLLRRFSIDELPQLWNVALGQMSMVGPRPEEIAVVERYGPEHRSRLQVKPGLTGPMQVFGRGELTLTERLAVEHDYIENMSLARDMQILALTIPAVLQGRGAF